MTREDALRRTNEYPIEYRRGRVWISTAVIAALVSAIASAAASTAFAKFKNDDYEKRITHLEQTTASAEDVRYVRTRIDYAIDKLIQIQETIRK